MITITKTEVVDNNNLKTMEMRGLSTDTKPIENVGNGSIFLEIDTGDIYLYDIERKKWNNIEGGSEEQTYTVVFNSMGGSSVASQTVESGETLTEPADPTKTDYTFDGWYTEDTYDNEYDFNTPVESDITLYAKWIEITPPTPTGYIVYADGKSLYPDDMFDTPIIPNNGSATFPANSNINFFFYDDYAGEGIADEINIYEGTDDTGTLLIHIPSPGYGQYDITSLPNSYVNLEEMYSYIHINSLSSNLYIKINYIPEI